MRCTAEEMGVSVLVYGGSRYGNYFLFLNGDEVVTCFNQQFRSMADNDSGAVQRVDLRDEKMTAFSSNLMV